MQMDLALSQVESLLLPKRLLFVKFFARWKLHESNAQGE